MGAPALDLLVWFDGVDHDALARTLESVSDPIPDDVRVLVLTDEAHARDLEQLLAGRHRMLLASAADVGGQVAAWNLAVQQSDARFVAPIEAGTRFFARGVSDLAHLARGADAVAAYADHASTSADGGMVPHYKPAWSPDRLRCWDYLGAPLLFRAQSMRSIGGFDPQLDARASRLDALWCLVEAGGTVAHLPHLVVASNDRVASAALAEVSNRHFARTAFPASASAADGETCLHIDAKLDEQPMVSIVIPTAGAHAVVDGHDRLLVADAVRSIREGTDYEHFEIIAVIDRNCPEEVLAGLVAESVRCIPNDQPFNFSGACNLGASFSRGDIVVLLNDDTEVVDSHWLHALVMHLADPDVGAVGAKLLYEDDTVQHAGLLGRHGTVRHRYPGAAMNDSGYDHYLESVVTVGAATGACLAIRLDDLIHAGALSLQFPLNYNDVDLCMKLRGLGKRIVVDNTVRLRHFESKTRTPGMEPWEDLAAQARWEQWLRFDPYDSPSFELGGFDDDPISAERHLEALEHSMQQPIRTLPMTPLAG